MNLAISDTKSISREGKPRKSARQRVRLFVKYRSTNSLEYFTAQCRNLSLGGMFIASQRPMAQGSLLKLECESEAISSALRSVVQVIWVRGEQQEDGPPGMGVKFVETNQVHAAEVIERLLQTYGPSTPVEDGTTDAITDDANGYLRRKAVENTPVELNRYGAMLEGAEQKDTPISDLNAQPLESPLESNAVVAKADEQSVAKDQMPVNGKATQEGVVLGDRGVPASWTIETESDAPVTPLVLDDDLYVEVSESGSQPNPRSGVYALPADEDYTKPFPWRKAIIWSAASCVILGVLIVICII